MPPHETDPEAPPEPPPDGDNPPASDVPAGLIGGGGVGSHPSTFPESVKVRFGTRACSGGFDKPRFYISEFTAEDFFASAPSSAFCPPPSGGCDRPGYRPGSRMFFDVAVALYDEEDSDPTNRDALDSLAEKIATDYYLWNSIHYDFSYHGIASPSPSGIDDQVIIEYLEDYVQTRRATGLHNSHPEELGHWDGAASECDREADPCHYVYGAGARCSGGRVVLPKYRLCLEEGRLRMTYVEDDVR